jgi:NADH-quinone oxidoreductase subunit K
MTINLVQYLIVAMVLFLLGTLGILLNRKNIIIMLMSIELILLAVNANFIIFSVYLNDLIGELFSLFILTVAAAESAIGLAILVAYYRIKGTIAVKYINLIKG